MTRKIKILWVDDEIDMLKSYLIFLEEKGYSVTPVYNGIDALKILNEQIFDVIILDEHMPGIDGLTLTSEIHKTYKNIPIIMLTKNEEENIIENAIASHIVDYLIKPVNPKQLLSSLKKITDTEKLQQEKTLSDFYREFKKILNSINYAQTIEDWLSIYRNIVFYDIELQKINDTNSLELIEAQYKEANNAFSKFVKNNYLTLLINDTNNSIVMSQNILQRKFFPFLKHNNKAILLLIDNLRYDHLLFIQPLISKYYNVETNLYFSILPTATAYARNSIFSGLMPSEIQKLYPNLWIDETEDDLKNQYEQELFNRLCIRNGIREKFFFKKIVTTDDSRRLLNEINGLLNNFNYGVIIYNFIDILTHTQPQSKPVKEMSSNNFSYRNLIYSWFEYSSLYQIIKICSENNFSIFLTTDHGSVRIESPIKILGEKNITTNLRYKYGKNIKYPEKEVFIISNPSKAFLPQTTVAGEYIFATNNDFFAYINNYNQYVKFYRNTYQHGGISLEEILVPFSYLTLK
ncbi:MAG: response regulator [Bacteroidales bacterium]|nr:response regulator [Bacteroidales bacterium]